MIIKATESEIEDGTLGACIHCGEFFSGVEPDAREYECESCGNKTVYGLAELLFMNKLELKEDDDDE